MYIVGDRLKSSVIPGMGILDPSVYFVLGNRRGPPAPTAVGTDEIRTKKRESPSINGGGDWHYVQGLCADAHRLVKAIPRLNMLKWGWNALDSKDIPVLGSSLKLSTLF